jgi:hypothetical protein
MHCGNPAVHTQRLVASAELIVVGAGNVYEARCRRCFEPHLAQQKIEEQAGAQAPKNAEPPAPKSRAANS